MPQVEAGQIVVVDPECRLIGLHLYDGHFKVRAGSASTAELAGASRLAHVGA